MQDPSSGLQQVGASCSARGRQQAGHRKSHKMTSFEVTKLLRQHGQALTLPSCAFVTGTGEERSRGAPRWGRLGSPATGAQLPT